MAAYNGAFFERIQVGSTRSAAVVLGHLFQLWQPSSIIDVGCGSGAWLLQAQKFGVRDILGVDFPSTKSHLVISADCFIGRSLDQPIEVNRTFDLAMSLEVAEHLDANCARQFIEGLTKLSDRVLFSAAIPFQAGHDHQNEQWQTYWEAIFGSYEFQPFDVIRPLIWNDSQVAPWYRQNTLLYLKNVSSNLELKDRIMKAHYPAMTNIVHPENYERFADASKADLRRVGLKRLLCQLPFVAGNSVFGRLKAFFGPCGEDK